MFFVFVHSKDKTYLVTNARRLLIHKYVINNRQLTVVRMNFQTLFQGFLSKIAVIYGMSQVDLFVSVCLNVWLV